MPGLKLTDDKKGKKSKKGPRCQLFQNLKIDGVHYLINLSYSGLI